MSGNHNSETPPPNQESEESFDDDESDASSNYDGPVTDRNHKTFYLREDRREMLGDVRMHVETELHFNRDEKLNVEKNRHV